MRTRREQMTTNRIEQYMAAYRIYPDECVGATEADCEAEIRRLPNYCTQLSVTRCAECSLANYGMDCHGNKVAQIIEAI